MIWRYNDQDYSEQHDPSLYGFTYLVHFENGNGDVFKYYGKRKWNSVTKKHFGKKKLATMSDRRLKTYEMITKENAWQDYVGSSKETDGLIPIHKEIIEFARTSRELTYMETKLLFVRSAIEDESCINRNILKRFFRDNLV